MSHQNILNHYTAEELLTMAIDYLQHSLSMDSSSPTYDAVESFAKHLYDECDCTYDESTDIAWEYIEEAEEIEMEFS